ncbi:glycosyltransferase family 2 protein [Piscinibacter sp.]|uniref:glycosyltransferase family 2 protein n=1 Tax=Piscinibacter sp. TaxID=1903157 RepID=UPI002B945E39|nr:glycosyltransferase family 2 protein [Albitalea sp.]HUG21931.1 glycosyltransferase family 2 protein [Albitalea sp.]
MPAINLSVILITRNEADNIAGCLASVAFADEWIVVDSNSSDATREIAGRFGAKVTRTDDWPGFGAQKNRALALASGRWVLSIDADERVSDELAAQIRRVVGSDDAAAGYELSRLSSFCGQWMRHGDWYPDRVLRLFRRGAGCFTDDLVHERLDVEGPTGRLKGDLLHDSMPSLDNAIDKMNRYTTGRALDKLRAGGKGGLAPALSHGVWAFLRCYLLRRGFLDGRLGFVLAVYVAEGTYYRYLKMGLLAQAGTVNQPAKKGS